MEAIPDPVSKAVGMLCDKGSSVMKRNEYYFQVYGLQIQH